MPMGIPYYGKKYKGRFREKKLKQKKEPAKAGSNFYVIILPFVSYVDTKYCI